MAMDEAARHMRGILPLSLKNSDGAPSNVPTLKELAMTTILLNADGLSELGDLPDSYRKMIYERCSADVLAELEKHNPQDIKWTDSFWQRHCRELFSERTKSKQTWRETFKFLAVQREKDLAKAREFAFKFSKESRKQKEANMTRLINGPIPKVKTRLPSMSMGRTTIYNAATSREAPRMQNLPDFVIVGGQKVPNLMKKAVRRAQSLPDSQRITQSHRK